MSDRRDRWQPAIYALPGFLVYGIVHLALWPAQMSLDSIDQWSQLANGRYDDWHPVSSTLLFGLFSLGGGPAPAVFFHYLLLSLATGYFLTEARAWNANPTLLAVASVAFPLFPANFLIATILWKDLQFGIALIALTTLLLHAVRMDLRLRWWNWAAICAAAIALVLVRHNGIIAVLLVFGCLLFVRGARIGALLAGAATIVALILSRTVLLWALSATPQSATMRTIVAFPIIAAMMREGVELPATDQALMSAIAPPQSWSAIRCDNVVPFFFDDRKVSREVIGANIDHIYALAARLAFQRPDILLRQELCMTRLIWDPLPAPDEWMPVTTMGITPVAPARQLGIVEAPFLPELKSALTWFHNALLGRSAIYNRPAPLLALGALATLALCLQRDRRLWIILMPAVANCISLAPLIQSQDYRYVWPSIACSLLIAAFCLACLLGRPRQDRK